MKPLNTKLFANEPWMFQQGSAPAHKAISTKEWLKNNVPEYISTEQWPSGSPDLNPVDNFFMDVVRAAIYDWQSR